MSLLVRLSIVLLCAMFAVGNSRSATVLWCACESESESADPENAPESEAEDASTDLALPGRSNALASLASQGGPASGTWRALPKYSRAGASFSPPAWLAVGGGPGGPLRC